MGKPMVPFGGVDGFFWLWVVGGMHFFDGNGNSAGLGDCESVNK